MTLPDEALSESCRAEQSVATDLPLLLSDLARWVNMDSPAASSEACNRLAATLAESLEAYGLCPELVDVGDEPGRYLHAGLEGNGTARVALLGHHDTVFPLGTAAGRPFVRNGDRLHGPGVADMKGGLALAAHTARALAAGPRPFGLLEIVSASDEESRPQVLRTIDRLDDFDAVLCLECGRADGSIVSARKGARWLRVHAAGRAAHAGVDPSSGRNAVIALCREGIRLAEVDGARDGMTLEVTEFASADGINTVPAHASLAIDLRGLTGSDLDWAMSRVRSWGEHDGITLTEEDLGGPPPLERTAGVAALADAAIELGAALGHHFGGATTGGVSDGSWTAWRGVPTLDGLGPVGGLDHTPDEYVQLESFAPRAGVVAGLVAAVDRGLLRDLS
ncbi:MAG: M20/M25/M40 family metallo-hydrolase [Gaiellales bacterium]